MKRGMLKQKNSQVTIFVIIAIIIIAIIVIAFVYYRNKLKSVNIDPEIAPFYNYVQSCIKDTGEYSLQYVSERGGYMFLGYTTDTGIAYYYDNSQKLLPSQEIIEKQLGYYVDVYLKYCVENFSDIKKYNVDYGKIITTAKIEENSVVFDVDYPLTIKKDSKTYNLQSFKGTTIPVRLNLIYNSIKQYMNESDPNGVCMSCLYNIAQKNNLKVELNDYKEDTVIFTIRDETTKIKNQDYLFKFVGKFTARTGTIK